VIRNFYHTQFAPPDTERSYEKVGQEWTTGIESVTTGASQSAGMLPWHQILPEIRFGKRLRYRERGVAMPTFSLGQLSIALPWRHRGKRGYCLRDVGYFLDRQTEGRLNSDNPMLILRSGANFLSYLPDAYGYPFTEANRAWQRN
jgi:hypothetical protein